MTERTWERDTESEGDKQAARAKFEACLEGGEWSLAKYWEAEPIQWNLGKYHEDTSDAYEAAMMAEMRKAVHGRFMAMASLGSSEIPELYKLDADMMTDIAMAGLSFDALELMGGWNSEPADYRADSDFIRGYCTAVWYIHQGDGFPRRAK